MIRVLVATEDAGRRRTLLAALGAAAMEAVAPHGPGASAARPLLAESDVLVLHQRPQDDEGRALLAHARRDAPGIGIVVLGEQAAQEARLDALTRGADAYLADPVDPRELVLVVTALHRRLCGAVRTPVPHPSPQGRHDDRRPVAAVGTEGSHASHPSPAADWLLDLFRRTLRAPDGASVPLTNTECALLEALAAAAPKVVPRAQLAAAIGHPEPEFDARRLEMALSRLRRKLAARCTQTDPLRAERGAGYSLTLPVAIRVYHR